MLFIIIIGGILVLFIYITRLASKEIFSPSNKIQWEVGRAKDFSARRYKSLPQFTIFVVVISPDSGQNFWPKLVGYVN